MHTRNACVHVRMPLVEVGRWSTDMCVFAHSIQFMMIKYGTAVFSFFVVSW